MLLAGWALLVAQPASAAGYAFPVDLPGGPLSATLQGLAHQSGAELLFDAALLRGEQSPGLHGRLPIDAALARLLAGTELVARRAASGVWVIEARPGPHSPPAQDLAVPEILVVGRRTLDVDIRRRENDIQPYQVSTGEQVVEAHRDNLDQFFRSRVTANTDIAPRSAGSSGDTSSSIDLRGLGTNQTLVLVDGRRLSGDIDTAQPDINAIPLHAIERVETLTGTAGGIYGLDALGGVVNVVLRHDYHGIELHGSTGISGRGDAKQLQLEGGIGFTPDGGRTDISLYASHGWNQPLLDGQRGFTQRGYDLGYRFAPDRFGSPLVGNATSIASLYGDTLVLKPEYGGVSLGSTFTSLPAGFAGTQADLAGLLAARAGQVDLREPDGEKQADLTSTPTTSALIANVRHRFGGGIEAYFDALILRDSGRYQSPFNSIFLVLPANSPFNPFRNSIETIAPVDLATDTARTRYTSQRYTVGLVAPLPLGWRANADVTFGASSDHVAYVTHYLDSLYFDGVDCPNVNPFGDADLLRRSLLACENLFGDSYTVRTRYREQTLRLAGPLFRTGSGSATLSIQFQNRSQKVLAGTETEIFGPVGNEDVYSNDYDGESSRTRSVYGELVAPLISREAHVPLLKGLTVQLAIRHDARRVSFTYYNMLFQREVVHPAFTGTMYTAGAKFHPLPWLMLRGSYATGRQPPPVSNLKIQGFSEYLSELVDPRRGNAILTDDGYYVLLDGGLKLRPVNASTLALGMVFNPDGDRGPRVSLDYSRTRRTGDLSDSVGEYVLEHEDEFPGRVTRAPLTDADRAKGYTAGVVTQIDATGLALGRLTVKSIDARLDWRMPFANGILHLYGSATRQLSNRQSGPFEPTVERTGYGDGPLKWRANGGADWTIKRTTLGLNVQYYGRYQVTGYEYVDFTEYNSAPQGSKYVKAQAYVDLYATRRFMTHWDGADHPMSVDFAIINLFDHAPSYESRNDLQGSQYSAYGDPRQRRFELTLNASF